MAKFSRAETFEIGEDFLRIGRPPRVARIGFQREKADAGERLVFDLDSVERWDSGAEISLDELTRLLDLLERECDARGIEAEFE